jgi:hypothetical protein
MDELFIPNTMTTFNREQQYVHYMSKVDLNEITDKKSLLKSLDFESRCMPEGLPIPPIDSHIQNIFNITNRKTSYRFASDKHFPIASEKKIVEALEKYFESNSTTTVIELTEPSDSGPSPYKLIINGPDDIKYAKNMVKMYKLLIEDFKKTNSDKLQKYTRHNIFDRFLYLNRALDDEGLKVIYDTDTNRIMHVHFAFSEYVKSEELDINLARYSHFRSKSKMTKDWQIPIKEIRFDFNYLFCFYRKSLKSIASIDILE